MRIAFIRLRSLGDTVLMTPVLEVAKRRPNTRVAVVSEEPFHEVLEENPNVDHLIVSRKRNKFVSRIQVIRELRRFRPDVVIDLHGGTTSSLITFCSGGRKRVGFSKSRNSFLYNCQVPSSEKVWQRSNLHTVEHQLTPLLYLDFPVEPIPPLFMSDCPSEGDAQKNDAVTGRDYVLMHLAAAFETKQWPVENFATLALLLAEDGYEILATVGPGQEGTLSRFNELTDGKMSLMAPSTLAEFRRAASSCRLYVGNDTGTTHIAAALSKPVLVIFGSSDFGVWHPWRTEYELVRSDFPCIPCPGYRCLHYSEPRCIQSVPVEAVSAAAKRLLK